MPSKKPRSPSLSFLGATPVSASASVDYLTQFITGVPENVLQERCHALRPARTVKHRDVLRVRGGRITLHRPRRKMVDALNTLCEALCAEYGGTYRLTELELSIDLRSQDRNPAALPELLKQLRRHHAPDAAVGSRVVESRGRGTSTMLRVVMDGDPIHYEGSPNATEYQGHDGAHGGSLRYRSYLKTSDGISGVRRSLPEHQWSARLEVTLFEQGLTTRGLESTFNLVCGFPLRRTFVPLFRMAFPLIRESLPVLDEAPDIDHLRAQIRSWRHRRISQEFQVGVRAIREVGFPVRLARHTDANELIGNALGTAERSFFSNQSRAQ